MRKTTRLIVLLGVLAVLCAAVFAVSRYQEKQEQIKKSGEVILSVPTDSVTAVSWSIDAGSLSFTKGEDGWHYDADEAFPVDEEKLCDMLSPLKSLSAAFVIEDVDDYGQYGLDEPVCTVTLTADETEYVIKLGDLSKLDEQRYLSLGDGKAYLATHDLTEEFDAVLSELLLDDAIPDFDTVTRIEFSGTERYDVVRDEEAASLCADDVYFTDGNPLDTDLVDSYLDTLGSTRLSYFVNYNASDEELNDYGLATPDQSIYVEYSTEEGDVGAFTLHLASDVGELLTYKEAVVSGSDSLPSVTRYARFGNSRIVYEITQSLYNKLTAVSYDTLRHQEIFTGDLDSVTAIDVLLDGTQYAFTRTEGEDEETVWTYQDSEFDESDLFDALDGLTATEFTDKAADGQTEIVLTLHLENEDFPTVTLTLTRHDGTSCHAAVNGENVALVSRAQTVSLIEAVNAVILN